jgi:hypothetical protein
MLAVMNTAIPSTDPISVLRTLTADQLRDRLRSLDAERAGIVALLRSVSARERAISRASRPAQSAEVPHE